MRILHVIDSLNVGGAERMLIDLVLEQNKRNHEMGVVCLFEQGQLADELLDKGIPVFCSDKQHGSTIKPLWKLFNILRDFQPDVVHSHQCSTNYYVVLLSIFLGKSIYINTFHGIGIEEISPRKALFYGLSLFKTDVIACVCLAAKISLQFKFPYFSKKFIKVSNGVVVEKFIPRNIDAKQSLLKMLRIGNQETKLIGIVARLNEAKNHHLLFEAFKEISKHHILTELVIVGDGGLKESLQSYAEALGIQDKTHFLGDRRDVNEILAGLDIYVLCSINEGYSISLLEAKAAGLPSVVSNVGGNSEITIHNEDGYVFESGNCNELAGYLSKLLEDDLLATKMGNASLKWAREHGSVESMADAYEAAYQQT